MINKRKLLLTSKVSLFVLIVLIIVAIIPLTISKYETSSRGNINSNIAFYLFHDDYIVQNVNLSNVDFSQGHYVLNFTVSNQNNNKVSDVDISYVLKVVTTTNLPFSYELYENEEYNSSGATNLINNSNTVVEKDEDGTYFQTFTMHEEELLYRSPKVNSYTLVVNFLDYYKNAKYQDMVESVRIIIDSKQVID